MKAFCSSERGLCGLEWGFLGDRFTSVPLPKAWMAFPVGKESRETQRNQRPSVTLPSAEGIPTAPPCDAPSCEGGTCLN